MSRVETEIRDLMEQMESIMDDAATLNAWPTYQLAMDAYQKLEDLLLLI